MQLTYFQQILKRSAVATLNVSSVLHIGANPIQKAAFLCVESQMIHIDCIETKSHGRSKNIDLVYFSEDIALLCFYSIFNRNRLHDLHQLRPISSHGASKQASEPAQHKSRPPGLLSGLAYSIRGDRSPAVP